MASQNVSEEVPLISIILSNDVNQQKNMTTRTKEAFGRSFRYIYISLLGIMILFFMPSVFKYKDQRWGMLSDTYLKNLIMLGKSSSLNIHEASAEYLDILDTSNFARDWLYKYTNKTHLAGCNYELVEWTASKFEEYGLDVTIKPYYVYLNFPKDHALNLIQNDKNIYSASLEEDKIPDDPATYGDNTIPTFHGYSANGNITGRYFYANYGRKQDFDKLEELGVDIAGKIAIVRYGEIYRGLKVKFAQEHGCIGVLIYSDPGDDGEFTPANGYKQYPDGPARHESSVQRGSVLYLSYGPGDPTTPGYSSNSPNVERKDPYGTIPKIPSLPVSYRDISPILESLNGSGLKSSDVGKDWIGKLPGYDYSVGPSSSDFLVNLYNEQQYNITPIWNVLGEIKGIIESEAIIIGNHRDGWAGSAGDPNSGSAAILEILRALYELTLKGWKPFRTIIFASFDGEEIGLVGSTEWAEDISEVLQKKVVAYLNMDSAVTGNTLELASSPVLNEILLKNAKKLRYPKGGSLFEHFKNGPHGGEIDILGSGSDYTVFLENLGIPSFDIGFANNVETDPIYQYHSNYDSFHWMETFADPGFVYHNLMSKYLGLIILELSGKEVIDFNLTAYSSSISKYLSEVRSLIPDNWKDKDIEYVKLDSKSRLSKTISKLFHIRCINFREEFQHWKKYVHSQAETESHHVRNKVVDFKFKDLVKFTIFISSVFEEKTRKIDSHSKKLQKELDDLDSYSIWKRMKLISQLKMLNLKLMYLERCFIYDKGLENRSWFKHIIYASGRYTGYAGQSLPGLREAIEDDNFDATVEWLHIIWMALYRASILLSI